MSEIAGAVAGVVDTWRLVPTWCLQAILLVLFAWASFRRASSEPMASRIDPAVRTGGWSLIVASTLFIVVFVYLAATFDYPAVLDGPASDVLPRFRSLGPMGRAVWGLYAVIPLLLVPAAVGARARFGDVAPGAMRAGEVFAVLAAFSMTLGLLRWPSIYWNLAGLYPTGSEAEQAAINTVFVGLNSYLGNFIGEFLG